MLSRSDRPVEELIDRNQNAQEAHRRALEMHSDATNWLTRLATSVAVYYRELQVGHTQLPLLLLDRDSAVHIYMGEPDATSLDEPHGITFEDFNE